MLCYKLSYENNIRLKPLPPPPQKKVVSVPALLWSQWLIVLKNSITKLYLYHENILEEMSYEWNGRRFNSMVSYYSKEYKISGKIQVSWNLEK